MRHRGQREITLPVAICVCRMREEAVGVTYSALCGPRGAKEIGEVFIREERKGSCFYVNPRVVLDSVIARPGLEGREDDPRD